MKDFLTQEAGPLPYWAWIAIALGVACLLIVAILVPCLRKKGDKQQEEGEPSAADENKSATEVKQEEKKEVKEEPAPAAEAKPAEKKSAEEKPAAKKTTTAKTTTTKSTTAKSTAAKTTATKTTAKKEEAKPASKDEGSTVKVYHISKRKEDKKWQVKAEGADKALRLFFTQSDAIEYAKKVAGNQEGRIVVHKEGGGFRKLNY